MPDVVLLIVGIVSAFFSAALTVSYFESNKKNSLYPALLCFLVLLVVTIWVGTVRNCERNVVYTQELNLFTVDGTQYVKIPNDGFINLNVHFAKAFQEGDKFLYKQLSPWLYGIYQVTGDNYTLTYLSSNMNPTEVNK